MEQLREHLGIDRWLLFGGSWGSTLILAYAERHPDRVSEIVIFGVDDDPAVGDRLALPRRGPLLPRGSGSGSATACRRRTATATSSPPTPGCWSIPDPAVASGPPRDWCAWEDAVISLEPTARRTPQRPPPAAALAFVRICTHYFSHGAWLEEGALLRDAAPAGRHPGRADPRPPRPGRPVGTAWELAPAWPDAELVVVDDSGHTGSDSMRELALQATARFGARR